MKKKTIVVVIENLLYGGTTTHLISFINSHTCKNLNFKIITNSNNQAIKNLESSCDKKKVKIIKFFSFNAIEFRSKFVKAIFYIIKPILFFFSILQMFLILKKISSKLILLDCGGYGDFRSEMSAAIASFFLRKKTFLLIHHCYSKPKIWRILINFVNLILSKIINRFIFVSKATKHSILKNTYLIQKNSKTSIIYNGIQIKKIKKKILKNFKLKRGVYKIVMLSRIEEYKGHLDLIDAFDYLNDSEKKKYKVFFIGNGDKKFLYKVRKLISRKKLTKYFKIIKYLPIDSYTILDNFDIFVSLTKDFEGFGYTIAESLFVGTHVISTNVGGTREFINNNIANIVKANDKLGISVLLKDFLINRDKWKNKSKLGKQTMVEFFNSERMSRQFLKSFGNFNEY